MKKFLRFRFIFPVGYLCISALLIILPVFFPAMNECKGGGWIPCIPISLILLGLINVPAMLLINLINSVLRNSGSDYFLLAVALLFSLLFYNLVGLLVDTLVDRSKSR